MGIAGLGSVLLPGLKGHPPTESTQPAVPGTTTAQGKGPGVGAGLTEGRKHGKGGGPGFPVPFPLTALPLSSNADPWLLEKAMQAAIFPFSR